MKNKLMMAVVLFAMLLGPHSRANAPGTTLYAPTSPSEYMAYARVIRLAHPGKANGTLLATFEHWTRDGSPAPFIIERSNNDGRSWQAISQVFDGEKGMGHPWSTMWQPCLFEFPHKLSGYPAGTLLLAGNVCSPEIKSTHFELWRSLDHGTHWSYVSTFQKGGSGRPGRGIWEPFLGLDRSGNLVCYFSDERQYATYSQLLGHIVSTDGGDTWGPEVLDVASTKQPDRPGMATVVQLPDRSYRMTYEVCGPKGCDVHIKPSTDGDAWGDGPADLGTRVETTDGQYLVGSPYLVWARGGGSTGRLLLAANTEAFSPGHPTPASGQVIFSNSSNGRGRWSWMPAPFQPVRTPAGHTNPIYSPCLLPSPDGRTVRLTVPSGGSPEGQERTGSATTGLLPYSDPFAGETDSGWIDYGGIWSVKAGVYSQSKTDLTTEAMAGTTSWTDYTLRCDVRLDTPGQAGLLFHVVAPATAPDSLSAYSVLMSSQNNTLTVAREDRGSTPLVSVSLPNRVTLHKWYRITIRISGNAIFATVQDTAQFRRLAAVRTADQIFHHGAIGLIARSGTASWQHIHVTQP